MSTNTFQEALWGLIPLAMLALGCLLLWYASWRQMRARGKSPFATRGWVTCFLGWVVLLLGFLAFAISTTFLLAPAVFIIALIILLAGMIRYRRSEVQFLVWSLAEAAQRGIPLEKAARAFSREQGGSMASTARSFAEYLDAGMPLSVALKRSGLRVSPEVRLAADMGEKNGSLGPALQKAIQQSHSLEDTFSSILAKFFYLSCIVFVMFCIVTFIMIKIMPIFEQMFAEFGLELPAVTQLLIFLSGFFVTYWFIVLPLLAILGLGVVLGLLVFVGVPLQSIPLIRRFARSVDKATFLNLLAVAVERGRSVVDNVSLLAGLTPGRHSRQQLTSAVQHMEHGMPWTESLRKTKLITKRQEAVLKSAERAGNLSWALNELADSSLRLTAHRAQAVLSFVFPGCLLVFGFCVFMIAVGVLMPLFSLIGGLA